jgi:polysaccharide biosynthesis/export protein
MRKIALALLIISVFSSCRLLRPSLMLKTPKGYTYDQISDTMTLDEYRLSPTDALQFRLLSNEGFKLLEMTTVNSTTQTYDATIESDGTVKMPLIGRVKLVGMTVREAEQLLETRFSEFYVGPFVTIRVTNKRIAVFHGTGGVGRVVPITNNHTTVFEALALAGGIAEDGKAYKIKLIRQSKPKPRVFMIDLSTIDGLKDGNVVVQANDIIYVEPRNRVAQRLTTEVIPYVSLITSFILIYSLIKK